MSSPNPSNYSREATNTPYIHARYRGACRACGRTVQSTPKKHADAHDSHVWIHCSCGRITRTGQAGTATDAGGIDR